MGRDRPPARRPPPPRHHRGAGPWVVRRDRPAAPADGRDLTDGAWHHPSDRRGAGRYVGGVSTLIFGAFVPQGWKMELASIDGAAAKWAKAVEIAQLAEQL